MVNENAWNNHHFEPGMEFNSNLSCRLLLVLYLQWAMRCTFYITSRPWTPESGHIIMTMKAVTALSGESAGQSARPGFDKHAECPWCGTTASERTVRTTGSDVGHDIDTVDGAGLVISRAPDTPLTCLSQSGGDRGNTINGAYTPIQEQLTQHMYVSLDMCVK